MNLRKDVLANTRGYCIVCKEILNPNDRIFLYKLIQPAVINWAGDTGDIKKLNCRSNLIYLHKHCVHKINTAALAPAKAKAMGLCEDAFEAYTKLFSSLMGSITRYWNLINKVSQKQNNLCFLCSLPLKTKGRIIRRRNPYFKRGHTNAYVICSSCNRSLGFLESKYDYALRVKKREAAMSGFARSGI